MDTERSAEARWTPASPPGFSGGSGPLRRIALVNPPMSLEQVYGSWSAWGSVSPPLGLCYIAAVMRDEGYEVTIIDAEAMKFGLEKTLQAVVDFGPDIVGIACKTLWLASAHRVATALKSRLPGVRIVGGGNHFTALPERTLREYASFDIAVIGEGERTFSELVRTLSSGRELAGVDGICFRGEDGEPVRTSPRERIKDLDELPMPALDLLPELGTHYQPVLTNVEALPAFSIVASRGCPCQCTFCDRSTFHNKVTRHSPEYTVDLIEKLYREHGVRYLLFDDDNLLLHKKHLYRILDLMKARGNQMPFTCQSRVDTLDEERLARLKAAGCRMILFGIESGSQQILDAMRKGITVDQIRQAVRLTQKYGIKAQGFFILGYPGETEQTMQETVDLVRELKLFDVGVFLFTPLPGSQAYAEIEGKGAYEEDWEKTNALDQVVFVPDGLTPELLHKYSEKAFNACYLRPGQLLSIHKRFSTMQHFRAIVNTLPKMLLGA